MCVSRHVLRCYTCHAGNASTALGQEKPRRLHAPFTRRNRSGQALQTASERERERALRPELPVASLHRGQTSQSQKWDPERATSSLSGGGESHLFQDRQAPAHSLPAYNCCASVDCRAAAAMRPSCKGLQETGNKTLSFTPPLSQFLPLLQ